MAEFYERYWAGRASATLNDFDRKWPVLAALIPKESGARIVDYGCGNGAIVGEMLRLNPEGHYVGVDVSRTALDAARARLPQAVFHHVPDGSVAPIQDGTVDFIFCSEVIEHIYDTEATFREFARLLRSSGKLLLTTPFHGFVKNTLIALLAFDRHFDPTGPHVRFFTKRSLFKCLRTVGLDVELYGYIGRFYPIPMSIYVLARKT